MKRVVHLAKFRSCPYRYWTFRGDPVATVDPTKVTCKTCIAKMRRGTPTKICCACGRKFKPKYNERCVPTCR